MYKLISINLFGIGKIKRIKDGKIFYVGVYVLNFLASNKLLEGV